MKNIKLIAAAILGTVFGGQSLTAQISILPDSMPVQVSLTVASQGPTNTSNQMRSDSGGTARPSQGAVNVISTITRKIDTGNFLKIIAQDRGFTNGYPAGSKLMFQGLTFGVFQGTNLVDSFEGVFNFDNLTFDGDLTTETVNLVPRTQTLLSGTLTYQSVGDMDITTSASHGLLHSMVTLTLKSTRVTDQKSGGSSTSAYNVSFDLTVSGFGYANLQGETVIIQNGLINLHGASTFDAATQNALLKSPKDTALALKAGQKLALAMQSAAKLKTLIP